MTRLIGPPLASTPRDRGSSSTPPGGLPEDLLRDAPRRLGLIALVGAILWFSGTVLYHAATGVIDPGGGWRLFSTPDFIAAICLLASIGLFAYTRRSTRPPRFFLNLGMAYQVFTALGIALVWHWSDEMRPETIVPMITWVGVVVLLFAAVLPNPPARTLFAGLVAASMNPIGMLIVRAGGGWDFGPTTHAILMHYPDFMLVGVALLISRAFTRLGQQVTRARELGSYHLGERIGGGGMGEVYRATHRMLARPAAIKLIRQELLAPGDPAAAQLAAARFRREAEVAACLESPHTVALYDFGVTEDRTLYFVMELLHGMDLEALVRRHGPLPPNRVIHILGQACASLAEAHEKGLVHRDIKPANIHVGRLGLESDFVKVLDFGLVKAIGRDREPGGHTAQTAEGINPGTPDYMAPEMARGEHVDGRADLYALGCVAYYMLTGRPVFEANNVYHMIARHLNDEPAPLSGATGQPLPPALEALVMACLSKDPAGRPESARALARALKAIPVEPWTEEAAAAWWTGPGAAAAPP